MAERPAARLRIAHFVLGRCNPDSANGVDKTAYHLARATAAAGHDVTVLSLTEKPAIPIPGVRSLSFAPRPGLPLPAGHRLHDLLVHRSPFSLPDELVDELRRTHPDVLHLHFVHLPQNVRLARIVSRLGIPYCVTINGGLAAAARRRSRLLKGAFRLLFERRYLERASFLHAVSEHDVNGLQSYGVRNRVEVIPNGIEAKPAPRDRRALVEIAPALAPRRVLVFVGRLDPDQKGLDLLLHGLARARRRDLGLVLVGPDWRGGEGDLRGLVERLGLRDDVAFVGPLFGDRKDDVVGAADAFVHTSRWEAGVPFSVLEAAVLGVPLLLTPAADPSGVLSRSGAAIAAEPDAEAIARGLGAIGDLSDEALGAMGRRARQRALEDFDWDAIARRMVAIYRNGATR